MKTNPITWLSAVILLSMTSCSDVQTSNSESFQVAVIRYMHETCTFCPGGDATIEDWTKMGEPQNGDELLKSGSFIKGFVKQADEFGDLKLVGLTSPRGVYGGSSRSWSTLNSFNHFMEIIIEELTALEKVDGVYLALHGAMAIRDIPRPEAEIAKRIRETLGEDIPIVGTFDLHGNEDEEFLKWANGAFVTKRYPHYDAYLQGERAARFLRNCMKGEYNPTTATRKPGIITPTVVQWTGQSPSMNIMERARRWESRKPGAFVSVFYGYPWSDVPDVGTCIHVITNNDQQLADEIADDMNEFILRTKEAFVDRNYPMPAEAVNKAKAALEKNAYPIVLGDYSDRPGDATWILQQLIDQNVNEYILGSIRDERVLDSLVKLDAKIGDDFDMDIGGFTGEQAGNPVRIKGTVKYFGPYRGYDYVAAIEMGSNLIMITPTYYQVRTLEQLKIGDVNPDDYKVFVVKSRVHFRRGFDETGYAKTILVVDAPGPWFGTSRLDALEYQFAPINELYPYNQK